MRNILFIPVLFFRYVAAIAVAYLTSVLIFYAYMWIGSSMSPDFNFLGLPLHFCLVVASFVGVLAGTFCLRRESRKANSLIMLGLGLLFYAVFISPTPYMAGAGAANPYYFYIYLLPLAVGGALSVLLIYKKYA